MLLLMQLGKEMILLMFKLLVSVVGGLITHAPVLCFTFVLTLHVHV